MVSRKTVLLLDDDAAFRALVREPLDARGMHVVEAAKGREATRLVEETKPSAMIIDGLLPDTNGVKWLEGARRAGIDAPVIFVSAFYRDLDSYKRLKALGVDSVIHKPLDPEELAKQVADLFTDGGTLREESIPIIEPGLFEAEASLEMPPVEELPSADDGLALVADDVSYEPPGTSSLPPASDEPSAPDLPRPDVTATGDFEAFPTLLGYPTPSRTPTPTNPSMRPVFPSRGPSSRPPSSRPPSSRPPSSRPASSGAPPSSGDGLDPSALRRSRLPPPSDSELLAAAQVRETSLRSRRSRLLGPRLLLVERDTAIVDYIASALADTLVQVEVAHNAAEAAELAPRVHTALVGVTSTEAPDAPESAEAMLRALREMGPALPVGFFALEESEALRHRAATAGADLFLAHPIGAIELARGVFRLEALGEGRPLRVVALADEGPADALGEALGEAGAAVQRYESLSNVLRALGRERPHLVLLGPEDAPATIKLLRMADGGDEVALVVAQKEPDVSVRSPCMAAGADDVVASGPDAARHVLSRARTIRSRRRRAVDQATQLPRRAQLTPVLRGRIAEAARHGAPFTLAFVELDGHAAIIDRHGPGTGQRILGAIAALLRARFRLEDLRARWLGSTFAVGLTGTDARDAMPALRRLVKDAGALRFYGSGGVRFGVRLSVGAASVPAEAHALPGLVLAAEERLREAKRGGGGVRGPG